MKVPKGAIKKIIEFCKNREEWSCSNCELHNFCKDHFVDCPEFDWEADYKKLKKEKKND